MEKLIGEFRYMHLVAPEGVSLLYQVHHILARVERVGPEYCYILNNRCQVGWHFSLDISMGELFGQNYVVWAHSYVILRFLFRRFQQNVYQPREG